VKKPGKLSPSAGLRSSAWREALTRNNYYMKIVLALDPTIPAGTRHQVLNRLGRSTSNYRSRLLLWWAAAGFGVGLCLTLILGATDAILSLPFYGAALFILIGSVASKGTCRPIAGGQGQFVLRSELDGLCGGHFARAQYAINTVLGSQVYINDLLGHRAEVAELRRHEWEIAVALRDISGMRAVFNSSQVSGPIAAAVLDSHGRALALAQDSTISRIVA
jgi:hypothetical protein